MTPSETTAIVHRLKQTDQDFEFYPTTSEIIKTVKARCPENCSVLDCGAGDGRVLMAITEGNRYAIEKAVPLIQAMPHDVIIVGTDFFQSTLIDKPVDVVFCNPPYSEFEAWSAKVISEAHSQKAFLVIPSRWKLSPEIQAAIKKRDADVSVIGSFDFMNAERAARAKVEVLQVSFMAKIPFKYKVDRYSRHQKSDPFGIWFDSEFNFQKADDDAPKEGKDETLKSKLHKAVIGGRGKVPALVELYNYEMQHLYGNFKQISALDADLLKELGTSKGAIQEALKQRITGLKNRYWKELFDNLDDITSRLTSKSRRSMLDKLTAQTNVDFTEENIYAVLIWVIKNANYYFDNQLIDIVEEMVTEANIQNYKSNQKVYKFDKWRYRSDKSDITHFGLELRIVLRRHQAIFESDYGRYDWPNNLHNTAHDFIDDILTIASNLNFRPNPFGGSRNAGEWESGKNKDFRGQDGKILISVRAFKNGNLHIKFNQKFIKRLNVEFGRLKGWLKDAQQAADEIGIPIIEASEAFHSNLAITGNNIKLLILF